MCGACTPKPYSLRLAMTGEPLRSYETVRQAKRSAAVDFPHHANKALEIIHAATGVVMASDGPRVRATTFDAK